MTTLVVTPPFRWQDVFDGCVLLGYFCGFPLTSVQLIKLRALL